jgi:hypothetical protein
MKFITLAFIGAAALAVSATGASADIVCNGDGDCWHSRAHAEYKPELKLNVHPDGWKWRESDHNRWREHEGRGYWRSGVWVDL